MASLQDHINNIYAALGVDPSSTIYNSSSDIPNYKRDPLGWHLTNITALLASGAGNGGGGSGNFVTRQELSAVETRITSLENLGQFAGSFNTRAAVPNNVSGFTSFTLNDFVIVTVDETHNGATTGYRASGISNGVITWQHFITYSTDITGKLNVNAQAIDSAKLGGQLPSYYATGAALQLKSKLNTFTIYNNRSFLHHLCEACRLLEIASGELGKFLVFASDSVSPNTRPYSGGGFVTYFVDLYQAPAFTGSGENIVVTNVGDWNCYALLDGSNHSGTQYFYVSNNALVTFANTTGDNGSVQSWWGLTVWETLEFIPNSPYQTAGLTVKLNRFTRQICLNFTGYALPASFSIGAIIGNVTMISGFTPNGTKQGNVDLDFDNVGRCVVDIALWSSGRIEVYPQLINQRWGTFMFTGGTLWGQMTVNLDV